MDAQVSHTCEQLRQLCRRLRAPDGCDWDRAQTVRTLTPYLLEETHEVLDAIRGGETERLQEELGDLLYLVFFLIVIAEEQAEFRLEDVIAGISAKLVRRHPHVFGEPAPDALPGRPGERWEAAKRDEKRRRGDRRGALASGAVGLPALLEAFRVQEKAAGFGFDWPTARAVLEKLDEERHELAQALAVDPKSPAAGRSAQSNPAVRDELGDLLFTLVNLSRHCGEDPEEALKSSTRKFQTRFARMESILEADGVSLAQADLETMESAWQRAKLALGSDGRGSETEGHGSESLQG
ncbi:MAG: nucleoside triphosphate pyrophosphohydrolase [Candidatus Eisenbacteria bacterium]